MQPALGVFVRRALRADGESRQAFGLYAAELFSHVVPRAVDGVLQNGIHSAFAHKAVVNDRSHDHSGAGLGFPAGGGFHERAHSDKQDADASNRDEREQGYLRRGHGVLLWRDTVICDSV